MGSLNTTSYRTATCGSVLKASSVIDEWLMITLSKCSAYLFNTASMSVRSVLPSPLRGGWCLRYVDYKLSLVRHRTSCPFCLQRTDFISFAAQPDFDIPESYLDCLANVVFLLPSWIRR